MQIQSAVSFIKDSLKNCYDESEITAFTRIILPYITKKQYAMLIADDKDDIDDDQLFVIVERLKTHEPVQYIIGEEEFFGLRFKVTADTLIPRPETEELVELILIENRESNLRASILDIGTGSGCIAVSIAKYMSEAKVSAWDMSVKALEVACRNAEQNAVKIAFSEVDVLGDYPTDGKFDIIVSNPPYIMEQEKQDMSTNVLAYEPHTALFVPDDKPLLFYERIADIGLHLLNSDGKLYFEINLAKGKEVKQMLEGKGYIDVAIIKDISRNDRIVKAQLNG